MKKAFITGATGFIGGTLVNYLLDLNYSIKVLVRDEKHLHHYSWKDKVEVILGDITNPKSFEGQMNDCELIIHSAAYINFWNKLWEKTHQINVIGTKNIVEEALKANPKKFIHISSVAAIGYGEDGSPIDEDHTYNWTKHNIVYMETKHLAEAEVFKAIDNGLKATIVNPANVWGAGDYRARRARLIKALQWGLPFYIHGATNFVDVDAVCTAIINSIDKGKIGERYILGGENLPVRTFLKTIANEVNAIGPIVKIPKIFLTLFVYAQEFLSTFTGITPMPSKSQLCLFGPNIYYDSSKAIKELDMPVIPINECIKKTVDFYKKEKLI